MISVGNVSDLADLAEAAYVYFDSVPPGGFEGVALDRQLENNGWDGWPRSRRTEFVKHWRVVAHQPNMDSGFSATVFERLDPQSGDPRYVVAMRGTEADVFPVQTYVDLASAGLACQPRRRHGGSVAPTVKRMG